MTGRAELTWTLAQTFQRLHGILPQVVAVAPGRVNLIGEHVDHQGYAVLPAALNHTIQVAAGSCSDADGFFTVSHAHPGKFPRKVFGHYRELTVDPTPRWTNYIVAAFLGVVEYLHAKNIAKVGTLVEPNGSLDGSLVTTAEAAFAKSRFADTCGMPRIAMVVDGNVPAAAGVSSSSALVVAATVALESFLGLDLSLKAIAEICANSERHVGTAGGGMDQAAICLCQAGNACHIRFNPLTTQSVPLPCNAALIVCNSCREAPKAVSAATCYNKRVFELKLAGYLMLRGEGQGKLETMPERLPFITLKGVQEQLGLSCQDAIELAKKHIPNKPISKKEALEILGEERVQHLLKSRVGPAVWERNISFEPLRRALHVYNEAQRVVDFVGVCQDTTLADEEKLFKLGDYINASDESLSLYFDCGCPELAELTDLARKSGAYGSRLIGAGWGGCTVSLVNKDKIEDFMATMKTYFDRPRLLPISKPANISDALFAVVPNKGISVFINNGDGDFVEQPRS